jgi:hypothetical protein
MSRVALDSLPFVVVVVAACAGGNAAPVTTQPESAQAPAMRPSESSTADAATLDAETPHAPTCLWGGQWDGSRCVAKVVAKPQCPPNTIPEGDECVGAATPAPTSAASPIGTLPAPPVPIDVKAVPATAKRTASGLAYRLLGRGTGTDSPRATDSVTVHYSGWTTNGKLFDSSITRGTPTTFPLNAVIKGWTEGVQLMKVGDKMRFWMPAELAYGEHPMRPGAPAGMLVFDVHLIGIAPSPAAPPNGP